MYDCSSLKLSLNLIATMKTVSNVFFLVLKDFKA